MEPRDDDTADLPRIDDDGREAPPRRGEPRYYSGTRDSYRVPRADERHPWAAVAIFAALLVCVMILGAFLYVVFIGPNRSHEERAAAPETSSSRSLTTTSRTTTTASTSPSSTTRSSTTSPSSTTTTSSSSSEPTTSSSTSAEPAPAPEGARSCGASGRWSVYAASEATSCPFAQNVALRAGSGNTTQFEAVSPVTGESYTMQCTAAGNGAMDCRNDTGAVVALRAR